MSTATRTASAAPRTAAEPRPRTASADRFIAHAAEVSAFYGFKPARELHRIAMAGRQDKQKAERRPPVRNFSFAETARACVACTNAQPEHAALAYWATPSPSHGAERLRDSAEFGLQVVGSAESIGEILVLKTLSAILHEWGTPMLKVRINCLGDRDSQTRFSRELSLYTRRRMHEFHDECRPHAAQAPMKLYGCDHGACKEILAEGPRSMTFLTEKSRSHFREVLEQLESLAIPYELDDMLVGDEREPRVVFAADLASDDSVVAAIAGGRFDEYVRKISGFKEATAVHGSIFFRKKGADRSSFGLVRTPPAPKLYFVQLGPRAKLQGLAVVDMLRRAEVPFNQSFDTSHLSYQLQQAQACGVNHILLMGQREALDGTIVLRSTRNSSQIIIPLTQLPKFLKTLKS